MIKVGDSVPLHLQLFDGKTDKVGVATVFDDMKKEIFSSQLAHVGNGLYINEDLKMPNIPFMIASYIVFDGDKESMDYERASDVFYLENDPNVRNTVKKLFEEFAPPIEEKIYVGKLIAEHDSNTFIEGLIQ